MFLALYFRGFWLEGPRVLPIMWGIAALGVLLIPWNAGASVFFVYAGAFAGDVGRPGIALRWLLALVIILGIETLLVGLPPQAWIPGVAISLMVGGGNIDFAEKRRADSRLRLAQDEVEHLAKVAERERIARDLHDLLGHTLSLIVLKSELAAKLAERDPARAVVEIRDVERISREALGEVRRAVQGYRALTLDESLAGARQALARRGRRARGRGRAPAGSTPRTEGVVALVLREAITNVIRHAHAGRCCAPHRRAGGYAAVRDARQRRGEPAAPAGTGLAGMRARVEELGGVFEHDGSDGTTLRIDLPLVAAGSAGRLERPNDRRPLRRGACHDPRADCRRPGDGAGRAGGAARDRTRHHRGRRRRATAAPRWRSSSELRPDVVLTDIEMPEMSGLELAAELKRLAHPARVIILTTFARPGYLRRALETGAVALPLERLSLESTGRRHPPGARRRTRDRPRSGRRGVDRRGSVDRA